MEEKNTIVAVGDETFTLGFELVGLDIYSPDSLETLINRKDIGIIILDENIHTTLSAKLKNRIESSLKPLIVILSTEDMKGNSLREKIIKALGVDIMNS